METNNQWKETKREYAVNENGDQIPKMVTYERFTNKTWEKKDILDVIFRSLAALSIGIPFIIFLVQRNAEVRKQKNLLQYEIYTNASIEIHSMLNSYSSDEKYKISKAKLFYEISPKLFLFNNKKITTILDELKEEFSLYEYFSQSFDIIYRNDSLLSNYTDFDYYRMHFRVRNKILDEQYADQSSFYSSQEIELLRSYEGITTLIKSKNDSIRQYASSLIRYNDSIGRYLTVSEVHLESAHTNFMTLAGQLKKMDIFSFRDLYHRFFDLCNKQLSYYHRKGLFLANQLDSTIRATNDYLSE